MIFYVDGSCLGNGKEKNEGGFGVVKLDNNNNFQNAYSKRNFNTTNNREELRAILYVMLKYGHLGKEWGQTPIVYSDSAYCVNTFNEWMFNWQQKGWLKSNNQPPENLDLIKTFYDYWNKGYRIDLRKVKGHIGVLWNEVADDLATARITPETAIKKYKIDNL